MLAEPIDLNRLLGGDKLLFPCTLAAGGFAIKKKALGDTGADGYTFVNKKLAAKLHEQFGARRIEIPDNGFSVTNYRGKGRQRVTHIILLTLTVDGRRESKCPFIELDMAQDVILGRKWFAHHDVDISAKHRCLKWPENRPRSDLEFDKLIPAGALESPPPVNPEHQKDAERRDRLMEKDEQRRRAGRQARYTILCRSGTGNQKEDQEENIQKMNRALSGETPVYAQDLIEEAHPVEIPQRPKIDTTGHRLEIHLIGSKRWKYTQEDHEQGKVFVGELTLHEIDSLIEDQLEQRKHADLGQELPEVEQMIAEKLPLQHRSWREVFSKRASDELPPHRPCDMKIELTGPLPNKGSPLYKMSLEHLELMREYIVEHLHKGFIVPSQAAYHSPVLFAAKPGGGWRFCVDFRRLNAVTKKDGYPLPLIEETQTKLGRAKIFTKLDIRQAFNRIRMHPDSEDLTSFKTRHGAFKYRVMPFGLTNGPATFQAFINHTLSDYLDVFCTAYVDDILIFSETREEHEDHVNKVLERLAKAGLQADIRKSEFYVTETKFLGFIVSTAGLRPDPAKVQTILDWKEPTTLRAVQSFLGFCNFYRKFIRNFGRIARPLAILTRKDQPFRFGREQRRAFQALKTAITTSPTRAYYDPNRVTMVETDASAGVVAGVLSQMGDDGQWHPVAFFSKTMNDAEMKYPIHDKEMLAVVRSLREWNAELQGMKQSFLVLTDHRALEHFTQKQRLNARQAAWSEILSPLNFKITYRPGTQNVVADALSRKTEDLATQKAKREDSWFQVLVDPELVISSISIFEEGNADASGDAPEDAPEGVHLIDEILRANRESPQSEEYRQLAQNGKEGWGLREGLVHRNGRLFVPDERFLRTYLIKECHSRRVTAHPGRNKLVRIVAEQYWWPGLPADVEQFRRNCKQCGKATVPRDKTPGLLHPLPIPNDAWQDISIDFKSMPKDRFGFDNVFVIIDRLSKRAFSIPCHKTATARDAAMMYYTFPFRIWGTPRTVVSDRGPQFISAFMDELCKITGTRQKLSTADHPQTDGNTEVFNQYLDQRLRPFINHYQDNWSQLLPSMDYAQSVLPHETTGLPPFTVETGRAPRMHYDWAARTQDFHKMATRERLTRQEAQGFVGAAAKAVEWARDNIKRAQDKQAKQANKRRREPDFEVGDEVWVTMKGWSTERPSRKLDKQKDGPWKILEKVGHSYKLDLPASYKVHPILHADRLRRYPNDPLPGQEEPEPDPVPVNGTAEWEVERIRASRLHYGKLQYQVDWVGWDPDDDWYYARGMKNAASRLKEFHEEYPQMPGPPQRLQLWLDAAAADRFDEDHEDDDKPARQGVRAKRRRHA